ncbi:PilW family protein [Janthinobacterium sp.]|uniref:PilW family protein n=1 Tax=Janthinobacterium sp. TaxID=1871054 RepID=UPI00293D5E55|nr:PilW family protein [Janthinobacterium sp.]
MNAARARRRGGFSVVELMVSVVIGLLALMFATRLVANSEKTKQASLGGSDAMQNGMVALFSVSNDAAQAGWGLNDPLISGCNTVFSDTAGFALAGATRGGVAVTPLAGAVIVSNGLDPDQLSLYSGTSMSGTGTLRVISYAGGNSIDVDRGSYGFALNDVILVAPETLGNNCALAQIAQDPAGNPQLRIDAGAGQRFNTGALGAPFDAYKARLFNLGPAAALSFHTWSVRNGFLQLRATDLAGASQAGATVIDNVVSLKAQYGFDTRVGAAFTPTSGPLVAQWSGGMIDADGDGVVGGAADYQHVVALRIAVVARSKNPDKPGADGSCSSTAVAPTVFSAAQPFGVTAVPVTVNVAVAGDPVSWKCYRYRVFETIVPLRNAGWRPTA